MLQTTTKKIGKYRQIIQNILRIIQECPYQDENVLIKTHKRLCYEQQKNWQNHQKKGQKR